MWRALSLWQWHLRSLLEEIKVVRAGTHSDKAKWIFFYSPSHFVCVCVCVCSHRMLKCIEAQSTVHSYSPSNITWPSDYQERFVETFLELVTIGQALVRCSGVKRVLTGLCRSEYVFSAVTNPTAQSGDWRLLGERYLFDYIVPNVKIGGRGGLYCLFFRSWTQLFSSTERNS